MTPEVFEKMTARSLMAQLAKSEKGNALYESYQQSDLDAYWLSSWSIASSCPL